MKRIIALGASNSKNSINKRFPYMGAKVVTDYSLTEFHKNFDTDKGISDDALLAVFENSLEAFENHLKNQSA